MTIRTRRSDSGFGLIEVLVGAALLAIVAMGLATLVKGMTRGVASVELRGELQDVRQLVRRRLNCKKTFPAGTCPATVPVPLIDDFGNPIFTDVDSTPGPFQNTFAHGQARVQTTCGSGKLELRFGSPRRPELAWPAAAHMETCQEVLGGTFLHDCGSGEMMIGINPDTLEPRCAPAPVPPPAVQFATGTVARSSPAGTTINPSAIQLHPVTLTFTPRHALCAPRNEGYTNSWLSCLCEVESMGPGSVVFKTHFGHGNHLHPVGCNFQYLVIGD